MVTLFAVKLWLRRRGEKKESVFCGQGNRDLCYSAGRSLIMEYLKKAGLKQKGCTVHCLHRTFASELLKVDADLVTIQDLLGHGQITTTQRYCRVANLKVQRDYCKAMEAFLQKTQAREEDEDEGQRIDLPWRR